MVFPTWTFDKSHDSTPIPALADDMGIHLSLAKSDPGQGNPGWFPSHPPAPAECMWVGWDALP